MSKVSRNDPCPCGSGKKYKKCCIDKVIPFPKQNSVEDDESKGTDDFIKMVKNEFANKNFDSLEQANKELSTFSQNYNKQPKGPFLGLSPSQMRRVLNSPFSMDNELFKIEVDSDEELVQVPIFNQALFVLKRLQDLGEMKGTQKGNLPRAFVIELYEQFFSNERYARRPNREDDLPEVTRLKHLLDISGVIKKRNNKFSITKKGASLLREDKKMELFERLFINFANKWNWSFMDGFPELYLIQRSVGFNFFILHKKCVDWTPGEELGRVYLEAFPALVREVPQRSFFTPEKQIIASFVTRFLERFCLPLGILERKSEKKEEGYGSLDYYRPTTSFKKSFKFATI